MPETGLHRQGYGLNDLRYDMLRSDEVDIVTLGLILKFEHKVSNFFSFQFPSILLLTDVPVLAEDTPEVAHAEEDGSRAIPALQDRLLAKVGKS